MGVAYRPLDIAAAEQVAVQRRGLTKCQGAEREVGNTGGVQFRRRLLANICLPSHYSGV